MDEFEIKPAVSREVLVRDGTSAVVYLVGGFSLMIIMLGVRFPFLGIILSGLAFCFGVGAFLSKSNEDKKPGLVMAAAGLLGLLVRFGPPFMKPFAAFGLGLGALGLFAAGIYKGIRFLIGLKSRQ